MKLKRTKKNCAIFWATLYTLTSKKQQDQLHEDCLHDFIPIREYR